MAGQLKQGGKIKIMEQEVRLIDSKDRKELPGCICNAITVLSYFWCRGGDYSYISVHQPSGRACDSP